MDRASDGGTGVIKRTLRTAQAVQLLRDRFMGTTFSLPSRFVMSASASTDRGACSLAAPLRDLHGVDGTSRPHGGLLDFFSWSDAHEHDIQCTPFGPRLLGGAPKIAKRPAMAGRKRPA